MAANPDVVDIHGTEYTMIAARLRMFRVDHPEWSIITSLLSDGEFVRFRTVISNENDRVIATGYAEEDRSLGNINKTSAIENAETSSVGRALAFVSGEYAGNAIRSADEMANAVHQQSEKQLYSSFAKTTAANEENHSTLIAVRGFLAEDNFDAAKEAWNELDNDTKTDIWVATTKGGWFTPRERQQMKFWSNDFETSRKG